MSRNLEYIKKFQTGAIGSPVGECIVKSIDVATLAANKEYNIHDEFSWGAQIVSCQVVWSGLTGVLDGVALLQQSNDGETYDSLSVSTTLGTASGSNILEKQNFSGKFLGLKLTKNGLTGGSIKLVFIIKHN